ncbi:recombinase family protein [Patescibacteria group bacterium]|nr:recombinase family protein [Patescibacteria group bacterium]
MRYIIYARKSTEDENHQVLSIESQLCELREFAAKEKLEIVASFQEVKTAKEPGRTKFAEMLKQIEQGKADGILSWHPDRLARNAVDGGKIIHLIDKGVIKSLKFPTFWFEPTPQGLFMLQIAFGQSKYYVDNLRENVTRGMRQKIRNGVWPLWAPLGYLNNPMTRGIDVDEKKAHLVKKMFRLYTTGNYTLKEMSEWCKKAGLKSNLDNDISPGQVQSMLQNIFYIGLMKYKGEVFEGKHKSLISKKLFDKVQEVLKERGKPQKIKHSFAFLGLMKCPCSAAITAEKKIKPSGREYVYYRCTKKKGPCSEKHFLREDNLISQIKTYLQKVSLSSQDTKKVLAELKKDELKAKEETKILVQNLKKELAEIGTKLEKLLDVYLNEIISTGEYTARKQKILAQKLELQEKIRDFEQKGLSWLEPAREFVLKLNYAGKLKNSDNFPKMKTFLRNIGSNHILRNQKLIFSFKFPFNLAADPAPRRGAGEAETLTYPKWWRWAESNRRVKNYLMHIYKI